MKNSVLIIGLDGGDWKLLKPWINNGELPTLKRLFDAGAKGDLKTTIPALSFTALTSLFTGKNPGKHGIFKCITDSGSLVNGSFIKTEKIWQILSYYNKRCGIINVPMTYPVEKVNGYMVSAFLTSPDEKIYSYPPELMSVLKKHDYKVKVKYGKHTFAPNKKYLIEERDNFLKELYDSLNKRHCTLKELMNEQWDFFMLVFDETAMVQHLFMDRKDIMLEFFKKVDFYIGDLIKTFSAKNTNPSVFIVSDHGFSPSPTKSINMKVWLEKNGFLEDSQAVAHKMIPKIYNILNKMHLSELISLFSRVKSAKFSFQKKVKESSNIYYESPGIFIKQGQLNQDEYEELRNKIIRELKKIRDPLTNEEILQIIEKREEMYSGRYSELAPDIIALPKSKYDVVFSYDSNLLFENIKIHSKGKHFSDVYGMFLAYGSEIDSAFLEDISILDIFPTVLHILDVPIPGDVDGRVLKEIFRKGSCFDKEAIFSKEGSTAVLEEKNRIKDSLKQIKI